MLLTIWSFIEEKTRNFYSNYNISIFNYIKCINSNFSNCIQKKYLFIWTQKINIFHTFLECHLKSFSFELSDSYTIKYNLSLIVSVLYIIFYEFICILSLFEGFWMKEKLELIKTYNIFSCLQNVLELRVCIIIIS